MVAARDARWLATVTVMLGSNFVGAVALSLVGCAFLPLGVIACGSDDAGPTGTGGSGGTSSTGGAKSTGGAEPEGGSKGSGGAEPDASPGTNSGGSASGGASETGGADGTGGSSPDPDGDASAPRTDGGLPEGGNPAPTTCTRIADACGKIDPGTGPVHDCVLLGASDVATCDAQLEACRSLCGKTLCVRLGSLCHDPDPGDGPIHQCHTDGHSNIADTCFDVAVHCYEICEAASE